MKQRIELIFYDEEIERLNSFFQLCNFRYRTRLLKKLIEFGMEKFIEDLQEQKFMLEQTDRLKLVNPQNEWAVFDMVKIRDGDSCRKCGSKSNIEIFAIDGNKNNILLTNLIVLCQSCIKSLNEFNVPLINRKKFLMWFYLL